MEIISKQESTEKEVKKIFISQPMNGKETEVILAEREEVVAKLQEMGYTVVDSVFDDYVSSDITNKPLYYLSKSLGVLSTCDCIYLMNGWREARGCLMEARAARAYGLKIIRERV